MNVEDIGTGPAVLALHGLGGGAYFFRGLAERLQPDYRVVSVDLPSTPSDFSSTPSDFSMRSWVADIGALAAERVSGPVVLLGHSMGTILALEAWAAWPVRIRGLIFVGGVPQVAPRIRERLSDRVRALEGAGDLIGWGSRVSPGVFSPNTFRDRPEVVSAFERLFETQTVETYVRCCRILLGANAEAIVGTVTVPSVAITGEHDQYAPPEAVAEFMQQIPGAHHLEVIPNCGHLPFLEQPEAFALAVKSFLGTC
jgi:pimeloyl-ACP methyl ester carboxylesterase